MLFLLTPDNNSFSSCVMICASFDTHLSWKVKGKLRRPQYFLQYLHFFFYLFSWGVHVHKLSFCQFFLEHRKYLLTRVVSKIVKVIFNQCNTKWGEYTESCTSRDLSQRELNIPWERYLDSFFFLMELWMLHEPALSIWRISVSSLQRDENKTAHTQTKQMAPNLWKSHPLLKTINNSLTDLPTPSNISTWWNFGYLLGTCLITQIITSLLLAIHYTVDTTLAFSSVTHTCRNVQYGWLIRNLHANGASLFFICTYLHIGGGLYCGSYLTDPYKQRRACYGIASEGGHFSVRLA